MKYYLIAFFFHFATYSLAQETIEIGKPIDIPLLLASNFGELRPNHFHSGLDFKTQGVINKKIYSIADGFVSRIGVNAGGYGLVLYIDHPQLGYTSVYGHLNKFRPDIASYIKEKQYDDESYTIDISNLPDTLFAIKKGDFIAFSGNSGSSGGPHLHFEIRDMETQNPIDPLPYYKKEIIDNEKPLIKGISIYQLDMDLNVILDSKYYSLAFLSKKEPITAWGNIGFGINAIDKMTGTTNIYGVKTINLTCDNSLIFSYDISDIDFKTTRMINSLTDYNYWKNNKQFFIKSMIDSGNLLNMMDRDLSGYININEEKIYKLQYVLRDVYNNTTSLSFEIEGKKKDIVSSASDMLYYNKSNRYAKDGLSIYFPLGTLTRNISFKPSNTTSQKYYSNVYSLGKDYFSLMDKSPIRIELKNDSLINKNQYGIVTINDKGKESWIGGDYENGSIFANIRELGSRVAISIDSISPTISPVEENNWSLNRKIVVKLSDNLSGIKSFKGSIDNKFALFQHDIKSSLYTYYFDPSRLTKGSHFFKFETTDHAGNISSYECNFTY